MNTHVRYLFDSEDYYTGAGNDWKVGPPPSSKTAWASRIHDAMYEFLGIRGTKYLTRVGQYADAWHAAAVGDDNLGKIAQSTWIYKHGYILKRNKRFERAFNSWVLDNNFTYIYTMNGGPFDVFAPVDDIIQKIYGENPYAIIHKRKQDADGIGFTPYQRTKIRNPFEPDDDDPEGGLDPVDPLPMRPALPQPIAPPPSMEDPFMPPAMPPNIVEPGEPPVANQMHFGHKAHNSFNILKF